MLRVWPAVREGHIFTVNTVHALSALLPYSGFCVCLSTLRFEVEPVRNHEYKGILKSAYFILNSVGVNYRNVHSVGCWSQ